MLRRIGTFLLGVWILMVGICRSIFGRNKKKEQPNQFIPQNLPDQQEWKTDWDGWEGVKVETPPPKEEQKEEEVPDLFRDMEPHLVKTKKIKIKRKNQSIRPNLKQFAIDPTYQSTSVTSELLDWPDEEGGGGEEEGWEREELPELLKQSRESLRQQRLVAMETQRAQLKSKANMTGPLLGATKINPL